jgi:hypothetical protein
MATIGFLLPMELQLRVEVFAGSVATAEAPCRDHGAEECCESCGKGIMSSELLRQMRFEFIHNDNLKGKRKTYCDRGFNMNQTKITPIGNNTTTSNKPESDFYSNTNKSKGI